MYKVHKNIEVYLLAHEDDIALAINDFSILRPVFVSVFGRKALSNEDKEAEKACKAAELAEKMTHPSYMIEKVFKIPLSEYQRMQVDKWRINKLEIENGSASS